MSRRYLVVPIGLSLALLVLVAPGVGAKKVTLTWWIDHSAVELPLFKQAVKQFEDKNPNITVKMTNMGGGGYYDKLMTAGAAGTMPDIYYSRGGSGDARFYARGLALDISPYVKKDWAEINGSDFLDAQVNELKFKNKWMALPYDYSTLGVYYNKGMLSAAGVPLFGDVVTWDEITMAGLKVAKVDANGKRTRTGFDCLPANCGQWLEGQMLSEGAKMLDDKLTKSLFDSAESLKFFSFISDLVFKQGIAPRAGDGTGGGYGAQKAAMTINGSWATIDMRKATKFQWDTTSLPCSDPSKQVTSATGGSWAIGKATKNPNEAWKFVKHLASPEITRLLIVTPIRSIPSRKSLLGEWSSNIKREGLDPRNADAFWLGAKKNGKNSPVLPFDYLPIMATMGSELQMGKKGVDQILKSATQKMNIELDKAQKRGLL